MSTDQDDRRRRRALLVVLLVALLLFGGWLWPGCMPGQQGEAKVKGRSESADEALIATVVSVSPVAPGRTGTVTVEVENRDDLPVVLTGLSGIVTGVTSGLRPEMPRCDPDWIRLGSWEGTRPVAERGASTLAVPVAFDNAASINQDNCKGVQYDFELTVTGRVS